MLSGVIELIQEISAPVKLGWLLWIIWCVAQVEWYRRGRGIPAPWQAPRIDVKATVPVDVKATVPADPEATVPDDVKATVPADPEAPTASVASKPSRRRRRPAVEASDAVTGPI